MAKISLIDVHNEDENTLDVTFSISNIDPKSMKRANALLNQVQTILSDGKVDTLEVFTTLGLILALSKL